MLRIERTSDFTFEPGYTTREDSEPTQLPHLMSELWNPQFLPTHEYIAAAFGEHGKPLTRKKMWDEFCFDEEAPVFELLTKEFIVALGSYLEERANKLGATNENPVTVLEVGAGNGRLTHFLQERFIQGAPNIRIIATDSGADKISPNFAVETLEHTEALEKYEPEIVIVSWMPYEKDLTYSFRKHPSVQEYLLIGEPDGGCCGDEWLTWGIPDFFGNNGGKEPTPPYIQDGFVKEPLPEISQYQICRSDNSKHQNHSRTVSFKRR